MVTTERLFWQKVIVQLIMPVSICWLMLTCLLIHAWARSYRTQTVGLVIAWLTLTITANPMVGETLVGTLESQYVDQNPLEMEPFDTLILLGGGTGETRGKKAELDSSGDRVAIAAQMFHADKVQKIIVTGAQIRAISGDISDPADQAAEILAGLGVPADRIQKAGGRNTLEEMRDLATALPNDQRIGLVTSAWHLPRALRRAEAVGLQVTPVPADFALSAGKWTLLHVIPCEGGFHHTSRAIIEYLGMLVGR